MTNVFGVFAKPPVPGTVKTRLAADIGDEQAAELYSAFVDDWLGIHSATGDLRILAVGSADPGAAEPWARSVGSSFEFWPQPDGDLGARMSAFFQHACGMCEHDARAVLVGSDSPNMPPEYVDQAFELLQERDVVIGPASDGGYYLIGTCGFRSGLFADVDWSSSRVFEQTLSRVEQLKLSVGVLPVWYDVDTIDDARKLKAHLRAAKMAKQPHGLSRTLEVLDRLF